jgi:hypothetical protein
MFCSLHPPFIDKSLLFVGVSVGNYLLCVKNNRLNWHNISLELRVKEKLLRYPEEVFFAS